LARGGKPPLPNDHLEALARDGCPLEPTGEEIGELVVVVR
jgi:hypothetical protein